MRKETRGSLILASASALLAALARFSPAFCAFYARHFFPLVRSTFFALNRYAPRWPFVASAALIGLLFLRRPILRGFPARLLLLFSGLLAAFCALWLPLYGVPERQIGTSCPTLDQARAFVEQLNRSGTLFPEDASALEEWISRALTAAEEALGGRLAAPRAIQGHRLADRLGVAGFYNPLTGQTIVNADDRPLLIPFTICHELAHQAGIAREDLANQAAWMLCQHVGGVFADSAALQMLLYAAQDLSAGALESLKADMKEAVRREFVASNGSNSASSGLGQRLFLHLSDAFLRLCGVRRGAESYKDVLLLIPPCS